MKTQTKIKKFDDNDIITFMQKINELVDELIDIAEDDKIKLNLKFINLSIYYGFCKDKA